MIYDYLTYTFGVMYAKVPNDCQTLKHWHRHSDRQTVKYSCQVYLKDSKQ